MKRKYLIYKILLVTILNLSSVPIFAQNILTSISDWGFIGGRTGGWKINIGDTGNVTVSGSTPNTDWSTIRGGFNTIVPTTDSAIVVTGKMEFIGGGFEGWSGLRYGLFYSDSAGSVEFSNTDSARWSGTEDHHSGYLFIPHSDNNNQVDWAGGNGTLGVVVNRRWLSTYSEGYVLSNTQQSPSKAIASAGVYDFAISIHPGSDGTNEIRFYLEKEGLPISYFFGSTIIDSHSPLATEKFNCVAFGVFTWNGSKTKGLKLTDIKVGLGDPLPTHDIDPGTFYLNLWGFSGKKFGGWKLVPGEVDGNVTILGSASLNSRVSLRGYIYPITPPVGNALVATGKIEFVGGGFEAANSLRIGLFYSDSLGNLIIDPVDSSHWTGAENYHSGYLFIPPSGTNNSANWNGSPGTFGAIVNNVCSDPNGSENYILGNNRQIPENAIGGEGTYNFAISIAPQGNETNEIKFALVKEDASYAFETDVIDNNFPLATKMFNCINFALDSGNTTTAINLYDVLLDIKTNSVYVELPENLPTEFLLSNNYPNPFNPTTNINYSIPVSGNISLKVYNILGQEIATLFEGYKQPGNYEVTFNGAGLASGVYFYQLKTENFVKIKKLMLLK